MQQKEMIALLENYETNLEKILSRFTKTRDGIHINQEDDAKFRQLVLELRDLFIDAFVEGTRHTQPLLAYFEDSISNFTNSPSYSGVENVKGVVASALARVRRNPLALRAATLEAKARGAKDPDVVIRLAERLHSVVRQLRERREGRTTLDVADEYDVQDLFHALLKTYFEDIRKEEWTPSYAGGSSRMDFCCLKSKLLLKLK